MKFTALVFILLSLPLSSLAENTPNKKDLPKSGSLASSISGGYNSRKVDAPWGGDVIASDNPLSGSVSKLSEREWQAKVFNNSADKYSVSVEVVQLGDKGNTIKRDSFSSTIPAHDSIVRSIPTSAATKQCNLNLNNWKNLSSKMKGVGDKIDSPFSKNRKTVQEVTPESSDEGDSGQ